MARSNTVALDFGRALFGPVGGVPFAVMVAISCFGALNGEIRILESIDRASDMSVDKARHTQHHGSFTLLAEKATYLQPLAGSTSGSEHL